MTNLEEALKYHKIVEDGHNNGLKFHEALDSMYWYRYIELNNSITGCNVVPGKCNRRAKRAHGYFSDYINKKQVK